MVINKDMRILIRVIDLEILYIKNKGVILTTNKSGPLSLSSYKERIPFPT